MGVGTERGRRREGKGVHRTSPPFAALPPQPPGSVWARDAAAGVLRGSGRLFGFLSRTPSLNEGTGTGELVREAFKDGRTQGDWERVLLALLVHPPDIQSKSSGMGMERQLGTTLKQENQRI